MILDEIVEKTKNRPKNTNLNEIKKQALNSKIDKNFPFEKALKNNELSYIFEVKKASPSKGLISKDFNPIQIAKEYEKIGASAVSVLTEPYFFKGDNQFLKDINQNIEIPTLRKDFIINEYMIYEAKILNASAILLISSILSEEQLKKYIKIGEKLGLSALVETHNKNEIDKSLNAGAKIIGVNNRDLKTFKVDINNSINLRKYVPEDKLFVSESGIKTHKDIINLEKNSVDGVLIGETLMKSENKYETFQKLKNGE